MLTNVESLIEKGIDVLVICAQDAYAGQTDVPLYLYSGATTDNNAFIFFAGAWSVLSEAVANGQFTVANCDAIAPYIGQTLDVTATTDSYLLHCPNWPPNQQKMAGFRYLGSCSGPD